MKRYFKFGTYCDSVVDLIVVAMTRALNMNLKIYQKGPTGNIQILEHITHVTAKEAHLKFTCNPSNVANNHYEAILLLDEPTPRHIDEEVTIESPCPSTLEQPVCLDDVIDLTDDSEMTVSEQSDSLQNNTSDNELQFPMHLFLKMEAACLKSLYCMSADCPFKHSVEGKSNVMNFQNVIRHKVCFSCGNIASRKWCGARKMTEYCRESETLTVYHIGVHKCHLKKDTKIYRKQVREAVL